MRVPVGWSRQSIAALGALVLAAGAAVHGAGRAFTSEPLPDRILTPRTLPEPPQPELEPQHRPGGAPDRMILAAVVRDPFRVDRSRPPDRYRLPATSGQLAAEVVPEPVSPIMRVVGVAALGDGRGLAAVEVAGERPRLVRIGEEFAGLRLVSLSPGEARLESKDTTLVLRLPSPLWQVERGGGP